jgi:hypothetical protein
MSKKRWIFAGLVLLLFSCSHGRTVYYPQTTDVGHTAEVMILRNSRLYGFGLSLNVILDDHVIAGLRCGEYMTFRVQPGMHTIGIRQSMISMPFEKGKTYYFRIGADQSQFGFEFFEISEKRARKLIKDLNLLK